MRGRSVFRSGTIVLAFALAFALLGSAGSVDGAETAKKSAGGEPAANSIDLNKAGVEELTAIPGIGPALARRIVEFRDEHGPFRRAEDLMKVKGIGEKSFQKIRPYVKVTGKG